MLLWRLLSYVVGQLHAKAPSRSRKLTKVMHEFTEKFIMTFANFLELGPHSQPKRKLIYISGEWGHYLYLHKKILHIGTTSIHIGTTRLHLFGNKNRIPLGKAWH